MRSLAEPEQRGERGTELDARAVLIVDPHSIFRLGMTTCLEALPIVGEVVGVDTVEDARDHLAGSRVDLAIVDEAAAGARAFVHETRVEHGTTSLVSGFGWSVERMMTMVEAGAVGVIGKEALTPETLEANVRAALHGASVVPSELMSRMIGAPDPEPAGAEAKLATGQLSTREQQVLRLIAEGHATREVAVQLSYSERTIKNVLHDVATKLGARSRSQAVAHAVRSGLI